MDILAVVILVGIFTLLLASMLRRRSAGDTVPVENEPESDGEPDAPGSSELNQLAQKIEPIFDAAAHPSEILDNADFSRAVELLCGEQFNSAQVGNYAMGANWVLRAAALEALSRREDGGDMVERAIRAARTIGAFPMFFLMRFLDAKSTRPTIGRIVSAAEYWWRDNQAIVHSVCTSVDAHVAAGKDVRFGDEYAGLSNDERKAVREFVKSLPAQQRKPLLAALRKSDETAIDVAFLRSVGELLTDSHFANRVYPTEQITTFGQEFEEDLDAGDLRSILIVGPRGVGKTSLKQDFAHRLLKQGWRLVRTSAQRLIADKKYIGEIEGQIRRLASNASARKKVAVYVDRMDELHDFGRSTGNENSVLDQLWPEIEANRVLIVSEASDAGLQKLNRRFPSLPTAIKVMTMTPAGEDETTRLASQLTDDLYSDAPAAAKQDVVLESLKLAQQFLLHESLPGSALSLLKLALLRALRDGADCPARNHVLTALSESTGLPHDVLDERQSLDVDALRNDFRQRIIGQDEAVDCLVERIAMLKAGLSDPTRPVGVFLFAGPTGTGKTEIAKTLAKLLFGSEQQMIRLDMSEFQDADSVWRLLGGNRRDASDRTLVSRIRERPFAVVLLDEFEKAHAKIWDIFLQVFDDGRLTDSQGDTADFRHAFIILTSNLGSTISNEAGPGFVNRSGGFSPNDVRRSVNRTFRREFVNRLDRVVVFNPLSRDVMRTILINELHKVLGRRGLRSKQWAVEWEDSAIEFLLSEGFTPDLGARPLRRAIERHLLAPLSMSIVQNRAPDGEQFLFVRSKGDGLEVEFVDPDADTPMKPPSEAGSVDTSQLSFQGILRTGAADHGAAEFLQTELAAIADRVESNEWTANKSALIDELSEEDFWQRDDRIMTLNRIELIDRIDSAASALGRLAGRLASHPENPTIVESLSGRLYVLSEGLRDLDEGRPIGARLGLRLVTEDVGVDGAEDFLHELSEMYRAWARARGMRLSPAESDSTRYPIVFDVSGFGSFGLLDSEAGVHVLEVPIDNGRYQRIRVRVNVVEHGVAIEDTSMRETQIVRRYRREPSPLVRDAVRGWRTGRIDLVLGGGFDLLEAGDSEN